MQGSIAEERRREAAALKADERLLWGMAHRVHRRAYAAGARSLTAEDIYSELLVAWTVARQNFDHNRGIPWGAYLTRGCYNHINRWIEGELDQHNIAPFDLDMTQGDDSNGSVRTLHERIADADAMSPDEMMVEKDLREFVNDPMRWRNPNLHISERTKQFIAMLDNPPPEIIEMRQALMARADFARERGVPATAVPGSVTGAMIFDMLGCNRAERTVVYGEIKTLVRMLSGEINQ